MSTRTKRALIAVAVLVGTAFLVLFVAIPLLYKPFRIPSASMEPTVEIGDRILVSRAGYSPERGDVVVSHPPRGAETVECGAPGFDPAARKQACPRPTLQQSEQNFVHRIVALGGDRLRIQDGRAVVNGRVLDEPYIKPDEACPECNLPREITIPERYVFVMGDNRGASNDSRHWGPIPEEWVVGEAKLRYWPTGRLGGI